MPPMGDIVTFTVVGVLLMSAVWQVVLLAFRTLFWAVKTLWRWQVPPASPVPAARARRGADAVGRRCSHPDCGRCRVPARPRE